MYVKRSDRLDCGCEEVKGLHGSGRSWKGLDGVGRDLMGLEGGWKGLDGMEEI